MGKTAIEWAEETWNPIVGCTKISAGCKNCYAERLHNMRHKAWLDGWKSAPEQYHHQFSEVRLIRRRLMEPFRWRKPRSVFCCSMSDLFHEYNSETRVLAVLNAMELVNANRIHAGQVPHRFMVLTKRARRMREILEAWFDEFQANGVEPVGAASIWFGVSVESQKYVGRAIELVSIRSPVPLVRFVSAEPLLGLVSLALAGSVHFGHYNLLTGKALAHNKPDLPGKINWLIVGGETGPGARPMHPEWVRALRDEAHEYGAAFFFKQWGEWFPRQGLELDNDGYEHVQTVELDFRTVAHRVGRRKAGRMLDGFMWDEYPAAEGAK